jgi:hypothetical protein
MWRSGYPSMAYTCATENQAKDEQEREIEGKEVDMEIRVQASSNVYARVYISHKNVTFAPELMSRKELNDLHASLEKTMRHIQDVLKNIEYDG